MAINFPDSPQAGDPHTEAGVTWTYDGEKWVSNSTAAPAPTPALWTRAGTVLSPATAGDDVDLSTGDLSAASAVLTANAISAAIDVKNAQDSNKRTFLVTGSGDLQIGADLSNDPKVSLGHDGNILTRTASAGAAIQVRNSADNSAKVYVYGSGDVHIGGTLPASPNITLNANGSGTFSGDVTSNVFYRTQSSGDPFGNILVSQLDGQDRLRIRADGEIAIGTTNIGNTPGINFLVSPDGTTKIGGSVATSPNITLNANGQLVLGNDFPSGKEGSHIYPTGQANLYRATAANQATWIWYSDIGGTRVPKIEFRTNGSAKFASVVAENQVITRSVTIDLEPDNPANYTTEEVDGEEVQVYSGPTLDVKEKLLDFVARIEALEAEVQALKGGI